MCVLARAYVCVQQHGLGWYLCDLWNSLLICLPHLNLTMPECSGFVTGWQIAASWPLRAALLFHIENKKHWPVHFCSINTIRLKRHGRRKCVMFYQTCPFLLLVYTVWTYSASVWIISDIYIKLLRKMINVLLFENSQLFKFKYC